MRPVYIVQITHYHTWGGPSTYHKHFRWLWAAKVYAWVINHGPNPDPLGFALAEVF